ncbi:RNA exonuclease 3, partial [Cladochytrium tenue]
MFPVHRLAGLACPLHPACPLGAHCWFRHSDAPPTSASSAAAGQATATATRRPPTASTAPAASSSPVVAASASGAEARAAVAPRRGIGSAVASQKRPLVTELATASTVAATSKRTRVAGPAVDQMRRPQQPQPAAAAATARVTMASGGPDTIALQAVRRVSEHGSPAPPRAPTQRAAKAVDASVPPVVPADLYSKVPRNMRQKILTLFYKEYKRIFAAVLPQAPAIAHERAIEEEKTLLSKSNQMTYGTLAVPVLKGLQKRPEVLSLEALSTETPTPQPRTVADDKSAGNGDGNFAALRHNNEPETKAVSIPDDLSDICLSEEQLLQNGYPLFPIVPEMSSGCRYHDWRLQTTRLTTSGQRTRQFPCCGGEPSAEGCSVGPHVYKLTTTGALHQKIRFSTLPAVVSPPPAMRAVVACDCEMSYTAAGMELTRVTVVAVDGSTIMDELVKPSFPVVDLNTR